MMGSYISELLIGHRSSHLSTLQKVSTLKTAREPTHTSSPPPLLAREREKCLNLGANAVGNFKSTFVNDMYRLVIFTGAAAVLGVKSIQPQFDVCWA